MAVHDRTMVVRQIEEIDDETVRVHLRAPRSTDGGGPGFRGPGADVGYNFDHPRVGHPQVGQEFVVSVSETD